jgi:streptogramin lyase
MKNFVKKKFRITLLALCFWMVLFAGCDKEVSRSPVESEAPKGFLYINSIPNGFTIFHDGKNTGRLTPDSISYIDGGVYEITLKKKYFKDTSLVVTLAEDEKLNVSVDIASNPSMYGNLSLQTSPAGAEIIINDSATGRITPSTLFGLFPGEYNVKFKLLNYGGEEIIAVVQSSKTNNYSKELRDTSVWVDYQTFNSGIQSNSLTAIAIDNNNVKWIGSLANGLIRFDELSFTNYNSLNSAIPSNIINCVSVDKLNNIWVGTDKGIGVFNGSSWITYDVNNSGLSSHYINVIKFDEAGNTWIGTSANLVKFDGVNWTLYNDTSGVDWIEDFFVEEQNKIWLGTKAAGIFILQDNSYNSFSKIQYNYPTYSISSVSPDNSNNIWFTFLPDTSGRGGVSYWDGGSFTNFFIGTQQNSIKNIFIDEQNFKWIATSEGLVVFDAQNNKTVYTTNNSLISSNNIISSVRDANGIVWITTFASGLNKFKPPR